MSKSEIDIAGVIGWDVTENIVKGKLRDLPKNVEDIDVFINSPGGYIDDGFGIYAALKNHDANVHVHIVSAAYSMASVIAMAGDTVTIENTGMMMVHSPASGVVGQADDMRKEADVLDKYEQRLLNGYKRRDLNISNKDLKRAVKNETWYTAEEALQAGFVDEITDNYSRETKKDGPTDSEIKWLRMAGFKHMPPSIAEICNMNFPAMSNMVYIPNCDLQTIASGTAAETITTTTGTKMSKELKPEADHEAELKAAVEANDKKWVTLLSHPNASNTKALIKVAALDISLEEAATMMDLVATAKADEGAKATAEQDNAESEADKERAKRSAELERSFKEFMAKNELDNVNKNAANDGVENDKDDDKEETAEEIMARLAKRELA